MDNQQALDRARKLYLGRLQTLEYLLGALIRIPTFRGRGGLAIGEVTCGAGSMRSMVLVVCVLARRGVSCLVQGNDESERCEYELPTGGEARRGDSSLGDMQDATLAPFPSADNCAHSSPCEP